MEFICLESAGSPMKVKIFFFLRVGGGGGGGGGDGVTALLSYKEAYVCGHTRVHAMYVYTDTLSYIADQVPVPTFSPLGGGGW